MHVLLLGGNGFLGSHLKDALLGEGHRVRVLDRAPERFRADPPHVDHRYGDVANEAHLAEAMEGIDVVFHMAWTTVPKTAEDDPTFDVESNLALTTNVLKTAAERAVEHLLFFSSGGTVYGPLERVPVPEDHPTEPISTYGATKLAAEKLTRVFAHRHGLRTTVIRPSNPYGPRQDPRGAQGAIAVFLSRALAGEAIQIWGDGSVVRDYLFVSDFAAALIAAMGRGGPTYEIFNIGSGRGASLIEIVDEIEEVLGERPEVRFEPGRRVDVPTSILDIERARRRLSIDPAVSLREGVRRTAEWLRAHRSETARP